MTERIFARTCSCGQRVAAGQRCPCKPERTYQPVSEAQRMKRSPSRRGYKTPEYRAARKVAIQRATGSDGRIRCEGCGIVVGLRHDRRGRPTDYQTHHIDGDPTNNPPDGSNLAVLCEGDGTNKCHDKAEAIVRKAKRQAPPR